MKQAKAVKGKKKAVKSFKIINPANNDTSKSNSKLSIHKSNKFSNINFKYRDKPSAKDNIDKDIFIAIK